MAGKAIKKIYLYCQIFFIAVGIGFLKLMSLKKLFISSISFILTQAINSFAENPKKYLHLKVLGGDYKAAQINLTIIKNKYYERRKEI